MHLVAWHVNKRIPHTGTEASHLAEFEICFSPEWSADVLRCTLSIDIAELLNLCTIYCQQIHTTAIFKEIKVSILTTKL